MLNKEFVDDVINRGIQKYGTRQCLNQTVEELAELIVEIAKSVRGFENREKIIEEVADVLNCFEYLRKILAIQTEEVELFRSYKLERLNNRIKTGE